MHLYILTFVLLFSSFTSHAQTINDLGKFYPDARTVVRLNYTGNERACRLSISSGRTLVGENNTVADLIPAGNGSKEIAIAVAGIQSGHLYIDKHWLPVLLIPADTLTITFNGNSASGFSTATITGKGAAATLYYRAREKDTAFQNDAIEARKLPAIQAVFQRLDSLRNAELSYFNTYRQQHKLPDWFVQFEQDRIRADNAFFHVQSLYRDSLTNNFAALDEALRFATPDILDNPRIRLHNLYQLFLRDYWRFKARNPAIDKAQRNALAISLNQMSQDVWDAFAAAMIAEYWKMSPTGGQFFYDKFYPFIKDKRFIDPVKNHFGPLYQLSGTQIQQRLTTGTGAGHDSLALAEAMQGNIVYIGFWFVSCPPCIAEIPYENALVDRFQGKPVKIVNICVHSSKEDWIRMSKAKNLKTLNLYADKPWATALLEKFSVAAFPHYVLIDAKGKLVCSGCGSLPSTNAAQEIEKLLSQ